MIIHRRQAPSSASKAWRRRFLALAVEEAPPSLDNLDIDVLESSLKEGSPRCDTTFMGRDKAEEIGWPPWKWERPSCLCR